MITFQRLPRYVGAEPFRPFRIKMASGETFEIRHPETISVGRSTAQLFSFMAESADDANERERAVSLLLMESIEPIDSAKVHGDVSR